MYLQEIIDILPKSIFIFFLSFFTSIILIPICKIIGTKFNLLDVPEERKQHKKSIVRIGGIAILGGFLAGLSVIKILMKYTLSPTLNSNSEVIFFISILLFFLLGLLDDIYNLGAIRRLLIQFLLSILCFFIGIKFNIIYTDGFDSQSFLFLSYLVSFFTTVTWLTGVTNSINWLDGLDGLASSVSTIIFFTIAFISFSNGDTTLSLLSVSLAGSSLGFFLLNSYPAKILMGDCGSYFLGFSLASFSLLTINSDNTYSDYVDYFPKLIIPFLILLVPIIDMVSVVVQRLINRKSPFLPDRNHFHHTLLKLGLNDKSSVNVICSICQFTCFLAIYITNNNYLSLLIASFIFMLIFIIANTRSLKKNGFKL